MGDPVHITIPHETVNDESVRILSWKVESNSRVEKDQLVCEVETSKALMEIHAPLAGIVQYSCAVGSEVPVGSVICSIFAESAGALPEKPAAASEDLPVASRREEDQIQSSGPIQETRRARLTPLVRAVAFQYGVALDSFPPGTLVRRDDVLRKAGMLPPEDAQPRQAPPSHGKSDSLPTVSDLANVPVAGVPLTWVDLPRMKLLEGRILNSGRHASIQSSVTYICRAPQLRARLGKLGLPAIGLDSLVVFEAARLLLKYPVFNALHNRGRVGHYQEVNIGWAIDGGAGLVVPVVSQADRKDLREVSAIMNRHVEAYVSNTLSPSDFLRGTFTVTNLTRDGVSFFQPLISQGQSAILGIGSDVTADGAETFYLTLAFDHQVAEGRSASQFVRELSNRLEAHALPMPGSDEGANASEEERICVVCQRSVVSLRELRAFLVRSEMPAGSVCSICLAGY